MSDTGDLETDIGDSTSPRVTGRCAHKLVDILIALCALLSRVAGHGSSENRR
jgi:hypothetical protein